jgi:hypothetical protein
MKSLLSWLTITSLVSACGATAAPLLPGGSAGTPVSPPVSSSAAVEKTVFVPLDSPIDALPADKAPGPTCKVTEHVLGPLADRGESLLPVALAADAQGAVAGWLAPDGLTLQRLDAGGHPTGARVKAPRGWTDLPALFLSVDEVFLLLVAPAEIVVSRLERASLRPLGERRFPRPPELTRIVDTAVEGSDLWLIGSRDSELLFFGVGREGPPQRAVVGLPRALPADPLVTMGRKDGRIAVLINTISGDTWLATERGVKEAAPGEAPVVPGPLVRTLPSLARTGLMQYGLQTIAGYPLSRSEDARLMEEKLPEAFQTHGTYGLPTAVRTGTHFVFGEAQGPPGENLRKKLSAVISSVDCRADVPR